MEILLVLYRFVYSSYTQFSDKYPGKFWEMSGKCLGSVKEISGKFPGKIRKFPGNWLAPGGAGSIQRSDPFCRSHGRLEAPQRHTRQLARCPAWTVSADPKAVYKGTNSWEIVGNSYEIPMKFVGIPTKFLGFPKKFLGNS